MPEDTNESVNNHISQRKKLFLGGLSSNVISEDLVQYFQKYGTLEDAVVMRYPDSGRSKGFGFVTYTTLQETEACLQDGPHTLDGKEIDMKKATPKEEMPLVKGLEENRKLFLGRLSYDLQNHDLVQYFQKYGVLEDAVVMRFNDSGRSKGFGFVTFASLEETEACFIDGPHILDGKRIDMKRATPKGDNIVRSQFQEDLQKRKLFIGSVPYTTTTENLKEYFSQFGAIEDCIVMKDSNTGRSRGFGYVTYSSVEEVDECQNNRPHLLDGRRLDTKRATSKDDKSVNENSIKRLFVGGLGTTLITDEDLKEYFLKFGKIVAVEYEKYKESSKKIGKERNFAFIEFYDYDSVDKVLTASNHNIGGRKVYVSKAMPKESFGRWKGDTIERGTSVSPWSAGMVASGFGGMGYNIRGNGLYDARIANEMFRSNLDSNLLSRIIEENLRGQAFGGVERSNWMNVKSRQTGIGRYGGGGPLRNQMRGGFRRGPY